MTTSEPIGDGETLTLRFPLQIRRRGGRKLMITPEGATAWAPQRARVDSALVKPIARAHRWRRMLEDGTYGTVAELAATEKINPSYVCRILRLTLLAPDVVEAILDGRHTAEMTLATMIEPSPTGWQEQVEGWISTSWISDRCTRCRNGIARADSPVWAKRCAKRSFCFLR